MLLRLAVGGSRYFRDSNCRTEEITTDIAVE
jgi:hypothetical protein